MKGFIEVNCYASDSSYNRVNTDKCLFPINQIAVVNSNIFYNGKKYSCRESYEEIKELIKQAQ